MIPIYRASTIFTGMIVSFALLTASLGVVIFNPAFKEQQREKEQFQFVFLIPIPSNIMTNLLKGAVEER